MVGLCRLCASLRKSDVLISVKDNANEICDKLRKCCQLNIMMEDGLPKSICQECISNLNISHKFYMKVQEAQETLQALYPSQDHKSEPISIEQTLAKREVLEVISSALEQDEPSVNKENQNMLGNKQHMQLNNGLVEHLDHFVNELKIEGDKKLEQTKSDVQETNMCENLIIEDSLEILEPTDDLKVDLGEIKSPHININRMEQEVREENLSLYNDDVEHDLVILEEKDSQSNEVIQQINDILSDEEINVEIEYMEYLEDEDEEIDVDTNKETDEDFEITRKAMHNSLSPHEIQISSWKNYKHLCFICDNIFTSFVDLKSHIVEEHNIKQLDNIQYKCFDCRKVIARYSFFLNHVRVRHHPELKLRCDACDLSCQDFDELTRHRSVNCMEASKFVYITACNYCFKSFNNTFGMQNHVKFQHASSFKVVYKCKVCHKVFQYKSCLKTHEKLHSDTKPFACDYCDKTFHTKLGLEQHLYAHVEEKVFLCNICHRSYKTSKSLDDHRKLHTEGKAFNCQFCSKVFSRKIQKITHERSHTGEMPFSCEQCDKKFRYRSALFVHSKIHTGHKPYACDYCEKTFSDSSNRNKHIRRMHANEKTLENKNE